MTAYIGRENAAAQKVLESVHLFGYAAVAQITGQLFGGDISASYVKQEGCTGVCIEQGTPS
jgi:hypothetical protein